MSTSLQCVSCLFPKEMYGGIIGENGVKIKEVKTDNNVMITNDKEAVTISGKPYRALRIEGDWDDCWTAYVDVIKNINESIESGRTTQGLHLDAENKFQVQFKIPHEIAGLVIGKQGLNLNEWRQRWTDGEFHVDNDTGDNRTRFLRVRGTPYVHSEAAFVICKVLEAALQQKGGGGGVMMKRQLDENGMDIPIQQPKRQRKVTNDSMQVDENGNPVGPMSECVTAILVEDNIMGKIIGKGGDQIKTIRNASHANITTGRSGERPDGKREIQIEGTIQEAQVALAMIHMIMTSN